MTFAAANDELAACAVAVSSNLLAVGRRVRVLRPNNSCAGDTPNCSEGMFRHSNNAKYGSVPDSSALYIIRFAVRTLFSDLPFDWAYLGEEVVWRNSYKLANRANSDELNGELSLINSTGSPCLAKCCFKTYTMSLIRFDGRRSISKKPDR